MFNLAVFTATHIPLRNSPFQDFDHISVRTILHPRQPPESFLLLTLHPENVKKTFVEFLFFSFNTEIK